MKQWATKEIYDAVEAAIKANNPNEKTEELESDAISNLAYYYDFNDYTIEDISSEEGMYAKYDMIKFIFGSFGGTYEPSYRKGYDDGYAQYAKEMEDGE